MRTLTPHYLLASDFDQTLSFHDSGHVLAELLGVTDFERKVAGLARSNLVQQGGELAYLIRHDPDFRGVRREHLAEAGRRVRLKAALPTLVQSLRDGIEGNRFSFFVVSAAPREVVVSALAGIVPPENIHGTEFDYDPESGEVRAITRVAAGYGKVAVIDELSQRLGIVSDRIIYVGDGSSDVHVMLHVNRLDGLTIAVSENRYITPIATRTVLGDNALSVLVPILEDLLHWDSAKIRAFFESHGFTLREWDKVRTDTIKLCAAAAGGPAVQ